MDFDALGMVFSIFDKLGSQVMKPALEQRQHARKSSRASRDARSSRAAYLRTSALGGCMAAVAGPNRSTNIRLTRWAFAERPPALKRPLGRSPRKTRG